MSSAAVLKQIREVEEKVPVADKSVSAKRRRSSKSTIPAHEKLLREVHAHVAAERVAERAASAIYQPRRPSKHAQEVLQKLLKRNRR